MQTLANYLLELEGITSEKRAHVASAVVVAIEKWLIQKGAADPKLESGSFNSLTPGARGTFTRSLTSVDGGSLTRFQLDEPSSNGQMFSTTISLAVSQRRLVVYVHQTVRDTGGLITPIFTDSKCPWVIRLLFQITDGWSLGGRELPLPIARAMKGEVGGVALAEMISSAERRIPIIVVSENEGRAIWRSIADELAKDLTSLAAVVTIDDTASWVLTKKLGKLHSCYRGAIRLYWPTRQTDGPFRLNSPVWTASMLLSADDDGKGSVRFRETLRKTITSVAALTLEPPPELDEIPTQAARRKLAELEARATSNSEELEIAKSYLSDNEQLRKELAEAKRSVATWSSRAEAAEYALSQRPQVESSGVDEEEPTPSPGEIRYYKKTHSTPSHDVLIEVSPCGHTKWQSANKADKAKKGLSRLLDGETWKVLQHCGVCTGGGMWRVQF